MLESFHRVEESLITARLAASAVLVLGSARILWFDIIFCVFSNISVVLVYGHSIVLCVCHLG